MRQVLKSIGSDIMHFLGLMTFVHLYDFLTTKKPKAGETREEMRPFTDDEIFSDTTNFAGV